MLTHPDDQNRQLTPPANATSHPDEFIEPAPIEFGANERKYRQIWRQGMVAILEARNHSDVIVEYNVMIARVQKAGLVFGKPQPAREKYASNEDFGSRSWSLPTRELAEQWAQIVLEKAEKSAKARPSWQN